MKFLVYCGDRPMRKRYPTMLHACMAARNMFFAAPDYYRVVNIDRPGDVIYEIEPPAHRGDSDRERERRLNLLLAIFG